MLLALTFPDFGIQEGMLNIVRIIATVCGALLGWFLCDPSTRLLYRITYHAATPGWLLVWTKLTGSIALAAATYFFLPLGGGGGGLGWGPGLGGGPGKGGSDGAVVSKGKDNPVVVDHKKVPDKTETKRKTLEVEILGGARLSDGNNRYYLVDKKEPPLSLAEMEDLFKKNRSGIKVKIDLTEDSFVINTEEDPTRQLQKLAAQHDIYTQIVSRDTKEP